MSRLHYYLHSGWSISSEMHIPEWTAFETAGAGQPIDITFQVGAPPSSEAMASPPEISPDDYCFDVPEIGRYRVTRDTVSIDPWPGADACTVRVFLLGSSLGALYYLRDAMCLHASIVATPRGAVAFCGPSGAGKSTLAAHLTARGCPLICDDLCRVIISHQGEAIVYPSASRLKLWGDALDSLGWSSERLARDHIRMDKYHVPWEAVRQVDAMPLAAIYLPAWGERRITRLTGMEALRRLIAAGAYRADLLEPMGRLPLLWEEYAKIVRHTPIFELSRTRDLSLMDALCDHLIRPLGIS